MLYYTIAFLLILRLVILCSSGGSYLISPSQEVCRWLEIVASLWCATTLVLMGFSFYTYEYRL